jgi:sulfatase modifying factor 1
MLGIVMGVTAGCAGRSPAAHVPASASNVPRSEADCPARPVCPAGTALVPGGKSEGRAWPHVCSFCLDLTEVTVAAYGACVGAHACAEPESYAVVPRDDDRWYRFACNWKHPDGRADHPVNCVTLVDARGYCAWRDGARLPTVSELQWAAAGGDEARPFPWGSAPPDVARLNACGAECEAGRHAHGERADVTFPTFPWRDAFPESAPVGSFAAGRGRFGHVDLAGNVSEYAEDGLPGACMGDFSDATAGVDAFRPGSCAAPRAELHASGGSSQGFRCASGGLPVRRDPATLEPTPG